MLHPEDGGSMEIRNFGIIPQHSAASQLRIPRIEIFVLILFCTEHPGVVVSIRISVQRPVILS